VTRAVHARLATTGPEPDARRRSAATATLPRVVHDVVRDPGHALDHQTRAGFERRLGHRFGDVRVHTGAAAEASARAIGARAYTVGHDVVFGRGHWAPATPRGLGLLAHELSHVVQQRQGGSGHDAEARAQSVAERVTAGQAVPPSMFGGTSATLSADDEEGAPAGETEGDEPRQRHTVDISWGSVGLGGAGGAPRFGVTSSLGAGTPGPTPRFGVTPAFRVTPSLFGLPPLRLPSLVPPLVPSPTTTGPAALPGPGPLGTTPPSPAAGTPAAGEAPSRLPLTSGRFSLGLRLGFPEAELTGPVAEALQRAEMMNQMVTGRVPEGWEAVDKSKLARAVWGIFSTNIAPDVARRLTNSLSARPAPGGLRFELDAVLFTDFSGAGLSFTIEFGPPPRRGRENP
jgi:hypothetical protein